PVGDVAPAPLERDSGARGAPDSRSPARRAGRPAAPRRPCGDGVKSQSFARRPRGGKVGIHTLGDPGDCVYICCGPAKFRVVHLNPRTWLAPVLTTTRA